MREPSSQIAAPWLVRLRWLAVGGLAAALLTARLGLDASLPWLPLTGAVVLLAATNSAWASLHARGHAHSERWVLGVLAFDTLLFTAILGLTGGPDNPFSLLYVVNVGMGAIILGGRRTWWSRRSPHSAMRRSSCGASPSSSGTSSSICWASTFTCSGCGSPSRWSRS